MSEQLRNKRVAALVDDGFEQTELVEPKKALEAAGAKVFVVSPKDRKVKGWQHANWGDEFPVDKKLNDASPDEYDALLLPGGVMNPDKLRINPTAVRFVKAFVDSGRPIGAICHGVWTLIEAGAAKNRRMTSSPSLATDLRNAGAQWVDAECVVDNGLVTSRKPEDIPAFNRKLIEEFTEGQHMPGKATHELFGSTR
jgi:protease I